MNGWEGIVADQDLPGFLEAARLGQRQPALDVLAGRACIIARGQQIHIFRMTGAYRSDDLKTGQVNRRGHVAWHLTAHCLESEVSFRDHGSYPLSMHARCLGGNDHVFQATPNSSFFLRIALLVSRRRPGPHMTLGIERMAYCTKQKMTERIRGPISRLNCINCPEDETDCIFPLPWDAPRSYAMFGVFVSHAH